MIKRHKVMLKKSDGGIEIHPLKPWLRNNPGHLPDGITADNTNSHVLRNTLKRAGWRLIESTEQILLVKPDSDGDTNYADDFEGSEDVADTLLEDEIEQAEGITFGLERDLQAALRANITQLEPGLRIVDGGKERRTDAGRTDILAEDDTGHLVVIELKAGTASADVIAQILAYMGAIQESEGKPTRGILVAGDFDRRVILAARAVSSLTLRRYAFRFAFEPVE